MTSHKPQCQKDMKTSNIMMVFNLIKQQKELSRADIAKTVKMSATSITRIINLLSELKIVYESHFNSQHLGRKSMLLRLTDQQYYFCTGAIDSDQILLSIFTLTGTELIHVAAPTSAALHVEEVCDIFLDLYEKALKELQLETSKIVYVGISLIGLVDDTRGLSLFVPQFNWSTTHIADIISQKICKPVCINNDVKAMLLGILYETPSYLEKISYCSISVPALAQLAITIMNSSGDRAILPEKSGIHWWIQVEANVIAAVAAAFRQ